MPSSLSDSPAGRGFALVLAPPAEGIGKTLVVFVAGEARRKLSGTDTRIAEDPVVTVLLRVLVPQP